MDTFPGCSLIDASVDARGLMHSHSLLAFPAHPACRLFPLSHVGCEGFLQNCHEIVLKRFKGCLHPSGPLRGETMLDKGLDLKENSVHGQTAGVKTGVNGQRTFLFPSVLLSRNFCTCFFSLEQGPVFSIIQLSMWAVVTPLPIPNLKKQFVPQGKVQGAHYTEHSPQGTQVK